MGHSQFDDASRVRAPWNAGKTVGTKRPFTQKQIWAIRFFLDRERRIRDRDLFDLAIDSKLRGCDLVKIRIRELVTGPEIRTGGRAEIDGEAANFVSTTGTLLPVDLADARAARDVETTYGVA